MLCWELITWDGFEYCTRKGCACATFRKWLLRDSHRINSGFVARTYKVAQKMPGRPWKLLSHFIGACDKTRINAIRIPQQSPPKSGTRTPFASTVFETISRHQFSTYHLATRWFWKLTFWGLSSAIFSYPKNSSRGACGAQRYRRSHYFYYLKGT